MSGHHACHLQRFLYKQKNNMVKMIKKAICNTGIWFVYTPTLQGPQNGVCSQKLKEECKWDLKRFLKKIHIAYHPQTLIPLEKYLCCIEIKEELETCIRWFMTTTTLHTSWVVYEDRR